MKKEGDRYLKLVEWSEEDGCYVGTCPELLHGGVHGSDERAVYAELCRVVEEAVELYGKDEKPLPPGTAGKTYRQDVLGPVRPPGSPRAPQEARDPGLAAG